MSGVSHTEVLRPVSVSANFAFAASVDDPGSAKVAEEQLRRVKLSAHVRQLAVEVDDVVQALAQSGLADSPYSVQPDDRPPLPGCLDPLDPVFPHYHTRP
jgi:hypothetical protein